MPILFREFYRHDRVFLRNDRYKFIGDVIFDKFMTVVECGLRRKFFSVKKLTHEIEA